MENKYEGIRLRNNSDRGKQVINIFWAIILMNIISIVSGYFELELLESAKAGASISEDESMMNDLRQGLIALAQFSLYILTAIFFLNWFRRAYGNAQKVASYKMNYEEKMAVWGFIIPIVNLGRPYKICKELLTEMQYSLKNLLPDYQPTASLNLIGYWWAMFLIKNFLAQIAIRIDLRSETVDEMITASQVYLASEFVDIIAAVVTLVMIRQIVKEETLLYNTLEYNHAKNEQIIG